MESVLLLDLTDELDQAAIRQPQTIITGKAYVLGDNVDTDQIIPAQYLTYNPSIPEEYIQFGKYALSSVPPSLLGLHTSASSKREAGGKARS